MSDQAPQERLFALLDKIRADPARAAITMRAQTELGEGMYCEGVTRKGPVAADEPRGVGGSDQAPNPVEITLAALATCQAITYRVWAMQLGIPLDSVRVQAEADVDTRGFFGLDDDARPGVERVRLSVSLEGPEPGRHAELAAAVERHCPLLDMLREPVPVEVTLAEPGERATEEGVPRTRVASSDTRPHDDKPI